MPHFDTSVYSAPSAYGASDRFLRGAAAVAGGSVEQADAEVERGAEQYVCFGGGRAEERERRAAKPHRAVGPELCHP